MSVIGDLEVLVKADISGLSAGLNKAGSELGNFAKLASSGEFNLAKFSKSSFVLGGAILGVATAIGGVAVSAASSFYAIMAKNLALTGMSTQEFNKMSNSILKMSERVPKSATDLANGLYYIQSAGFSGSDALNVLETSAKAASVGMTETKTVADALTSALNAYHASAAEAAQYSDIMTSAVVNGKMEYADLAGSIGRVLPVAAAAKIKFQDIAAGMAVMTQQGLSADEAATSLTAIIMGIEKPSAGAQKEFTALGLSVGKLRTELKEKGLGSVLEEITVKTAKLGLMNESTSQSIGKATGSLKAHITSAKNLANEQKSVGHAAATQSQVEAVGNLFPNIRAMKGDMVLMNDQGVIYNNVLKKINTSSGVTNDAFKKFSDANPQVAFQLLSNSVNESAIRLGVALLPSVKKLMDAVIPLVQNISSWIETHPKLAAGILIAVGALGSLLMVLGTIGIAIIGLTPVVAALLLFIGGLTLPILAGVAAGVLLGLAIGALVILIVTHWKQISTAFQTGAAFVISHLQTIIGFFVSSFNPVLGLLILHAGEIKDAFVSSLETVTSSWRSFESFFSGIVGRISNVLNGLKEKAKDALSHLDPFAKHSPSLVDQVKSGMDVIKRDFSSVGQMSINTPKFTGSGTRSTSYNSSYTNSPNVSMNNNFHVNNIANAQNAADMIAFSLDHLGKI